MTASSPPPAHSSPEPDPDRASQGSAGNGSPADALEPPHSPTESAEEAAALDSLESGDSTLLGELLESYSDRLRRIAGARIDPRVSQRSGADDALQDAFVDVSSRIGEYLEQRRAADPRRLPFFLWVRLLTQQAVIRLHREHLGALKRDAGREQRAPASPLGSTTILLAHQLVSSHTTPTGALDRMETQERFAAALARLGEDDREVLVLRHFEGLSNGEVAAVLSLSTSAASMRHLRALNRLKAITAELGPTFTL